MQGSLRPIFGLTLTLGVLGGQQLVLVHPEDVCSVTWLLVVFILKKSYKIDVIITLNKQQCY